MTLVEILVVLTAIAIVMTLAAAMVPRLQDGANVLQAANQIDYNLMNAKMIAKRDKLPTGIRLTVAPNGSNTNANYLQYLQYVQQPDYVTGGTATPGNNNTCTFSATPAGVLAGDYLELNGGGLVHQITSVNTTATPPSLTLALPISGAATPNYRIIRQPQQLLGMPTLQLPSDVAVDITSGYSVAVPSNPTNANNYDIIFSPSGAVIGRGTTGNQIILWVRDITQSQMQGSPMVVGINVRSGLITIGPVVTTPGGNPCSQVQDPRTPGM